MKGSRTITAAVLGGLLLCVPGCTGNGKVPADTELFIKECGYDIGTFMKGSYSSYCGENKKLAFCYLKAKNGVEAKLHNIENGENFWLVAKNYGVDIDTIVAANPELSSLTARTGQEIIVPNMRGVIHEVFGEKNLKDVAELYGVTVDKIAESNRNIKFEKGALLFIPGAKPKIFNPGMASRYEKRNMFRSPISGNGYSSGMGMRKHPIQQGITKFHNGVDIRAKTGTWVGAAAGGKVIYAGWINGYGKTIKIAHDGGYVTMYAHLSEIHVKNGCSVAAGKLIGKSGSTGHSTGPHLHFSIFKGDKVENPMDYIW
ncbi:MAG: M23 family metallopeptidase [Spirochaetia bacterium]|nr:M23 family metallopeptidase [Spirochaetia bacterium]